jgi:hypothetical protein
VAEICCKTLVLGSLAEGFGKMENGYWEKEEVPSGLFAAGEK